MVDKTLEEILKEQASKLGIEEAPKEPSIVIGETGEVFVNETKPEDLEIEFINPPVSEQERREFESDPSLSAEPGTEESFEESVPSFWQAFAQGTKFAHSFSIEYNSAAQYAERLLDQKPDFIHPKGGAKEFINPVPDFSGFNPLISPEKIKEDFGLDIDKPLTLREVYLKQDLVELKKEAYDDFTQHFSKETPLNAVSTVLGMVVGAVVHPSFILLDKGAKSFLKLIGVSAIRGRRARNISQLGGAIKAAKVAKEAKNAEGVTKALKHANNVKRAMNSKKFTKNIAAGVKYGSGPIAAGIEAGVNNLADKEDGWNRSLPLEVGLASGAGLAVGMGLVGLGKGLKARRVSKIEKDLAEFRNTEEGKFITDFDKFLDGDTSSKTFQRLKRTPQGKEFIESIQKLPKAKRERVLQYAREVRDVNLLGHKYTNLDSLYETQQLIYRVRSAKDFKELHKISKASGASKRELRYISALDWGSENIPGFKEQIMELLSYTRMMEKPLYLPKLMPHLKSKGELERFYNTMKAMKPNAEGKDVLSFSEEAMEHYLRDVPLGSKLIPSPEERALPHTLNVDHGTLRGVEAFKSGAAALKVREVGEATADLATRTNFGNKKLFSALDELDKSLDRLLKVEPVVEASDAVKVGEGVQILTPEQQVAKAYNRVKNLLSFKSNVNTSEHSAKAIHAIIKNYRKHMEFYASKKKKHGVELSRVDDDTLNRMRLNYQRQLYDVVANEQKADSRATEFLQFLSKSSFYKRQSRLAPLFGHTRTDEIRASLLEMRQKQKHISNGDLERFKQQSEDIFETIGISGGNNRPEVIAMTKDLLFDSLAGSHQISNFMHKNGITGEEIFRAYAQGHHKSLDRPSTDADEVLNLIAKTFKQVQDIAEKHIGDRVPYRGLIDDYVVRMPTDFSGQLASAELEQAAKYIYRSHQDTWKHLFDGEVIDNIPPERILKRIKAHLRDHNTSKVTATPDYLNETGRLFGTRNFKFDDVGREYGYFKKFSRNKDEDLFEISMTERVRKLKEASFYHNYGTDMRLVKIKLIEALRAVSKQDSSLDTKKLDAFADDFVRRIRGENIPNTASEEFSRILLNTAQRYVSAILVPFSGFGRAIFGDNSAVPSMALHAAGQDNAFLSFFKRMSYILKGLVVGGDENVKRALARQGTGVKFSASAQLEEQLDAYSGVVYNDIQRQQSKERQAYKDLPFADRWKAILKGDVKNLAYDLEGAATITSRKISKLSAADLVLRLSREDGGVIAYNSAHDFIKLKSKNPNFDGFMREVFSKYGIQNADLAVLKKLRTFGIKGKEIIDATDEAFAELPPEVLKAAVRRGEDLRQARLRIQQDYRVAMMDFTNNVVSILNLRGARVNQDNNVLLSLFTQFLRPNLTQSQGTAIIFGQANQIPVTNPTMARLVQGAAAGGLGAFMTLGSVYTLGGMSVNWTDDFFRGRPLRSPLRWQTWKDGALRLGMGGVQGMLLGNAAHLGRVGSVTLDKPLGTSIKVGKHLIDGELAEAAQDASQLNPLLNMWSTKLATNKVFEHFLDIQRSPWELALINERGSLFQDLGLELGDPSQGLLGNIYDTGLEPIDEVLEDIDDYLLP